MKYTVAHDLDPAKARRVVEVAIARISERFAQHEPQTRWLSDTVVESSARSKGMTVTSRMTIHPDSFEVEAKVPLPLKPFQKQAAEKGEKLLRRLIERAKAGEL